MSGKGRHFYEFEGFRFDLGTKILWQNGGVVPLTPRSTDVLLALVESRGDLVTRDELIDRVWHDAAVEEGNLSYTISSLRKVLGQKEFIQTVPRRGYRFTPELTEIWDTDKPHAIIEDRVPPEPSGSTQTEPAVRTPVSSATPAREPFSRLLPYAAALLALLLFAGAFMWRSTYQSAPSAPPISSLAVLPFKTVDGQDAEHRGFSIADLVITRLSTSKNVVVRPLSAVTKLDLSLDPFEAGSKLEVDAVLEGTVIEDAGHIRVTARLMSMSDRRSLWSGVFNDDPSGPASAENDLALALSNFLALDSYANDTAAFGPFTRNRDAYQSYVNGRLAWNRRDPASLSEAKYFFKEAVSRDASFALAYVGLADSIVFSEENTEMSQALNKALELDPSLGEAYATRGFAKAVHRWDWDGAEEDLKRAIELRPNYATAHHWYAVLLGIEGRTKEAEAEMLRALEIDPTSHNFLADLGQVYYFQRDYAKAEELCKRSAEILPNFVYAHQNLGQIYWQNGEHEKALDEMSAVIDIRNNLPIDNTERPGRYKQHYRNGGIPEFVDFYLNDSRAPSAQRNANIPYMDAWYYALAGQKEKALPGLERGL